MVELKKDEEASLSYLFTSFVNPQENMDYIPGEISAAVGNSNAPSL